MPISFNLPLSHCLRFKTDKVSIHGSQRHHCSCLVVSMKRRLRERDLLENQAGCSRWTSPRLLISMWGPRLRHASPFIITVPLQSHARRAPAPARAHPPAPCVLPRLQISKRTCAWTHPILHGTLSSDHVRPARSRPKVSETIRTLGGFPGVDPDILRQTLMHGSIEHHVMQS